MLTKLIMKRRMQVEKGMTNLAMYNSTTIISSTDYCEENVVSHLCKNIFTPRLNEMEDIVSPRLSLKQNSVSPSKRVGMGQMRSTGFPRRKKQEEEVKLEQEVIISMWLDEIDLSLKTYDIVSMMRHPGDYSCQSMSNELFNMAP